MNKSDDILKKIIEGQGIDPIAEVPNKSDAQPNYPNNTVGTRLECFAANEAKENEDGGK